MPTTEEYRGMSVVWFDFHRQMVVRDMYGRLMYSTLGYVSPILGPKQVEEFKSYYETNRKKYDFGQQEA